jgi:hypothetical protein
LIFDSSCLDFLVSDDGESKVEIHGQMNHLEKILSLLCYEMCYDGGSKDERKTAFYVVGEDA